jgi:hypothetical protein
LIVQQNGPAKANLLHMYNGRLTTVTGPTAG